MAFDIPPQSPGEEERPTHEVNSLKTESGPSSFGNGTGLSLNQARLANVLTKDNIGWVLILMLAGEVFGVTDRALMLLGGVC